MTFLQSDVHRPAFVWCRLSRAASVLFSVDIEKQHAAVVTVERAGRGKSRVNRGDGLIRSGSKSQTQHRKKSRAGGCGAGKWVDK